MCCSSQPVLLQQAVGDTSADAAAAGVASAKGGGGPPRWTDAIEAGRRCSENVWVVGTCGSWAGPRNPEAKQNGETNAITKRTRERIFLHF